MKNIFLSPRALLLSALLSVLLAACSLDRPHLSTSSLYDLGTPPAADKTLPAVKVSVAEINPAAWLDTQAIFYRRLDVNDQQPRAYAQNRWVIPPAQLLTQRLKARIAQAGGIAASAADNPDNLSTLKIEADDFSQVFESPAKSRGQVALRASVLNGRTLIAQKTFLAQAPAPSNDPEGGARALSTAGDTAIADIIVWLSTLPLKH
jgi:cholesterol transport system auxiliary component